MIAPGKGTAQRLADAGFADLVSVIPPGAEVAPTSRIRPDQLGKVPGRLNGSGTWHGYGFTRERIDPADIDQWGANVGLLGGRFPGLDVDSDSEALTRVVLDLAAEHLGPAPVRLSRGARRLLVYRTSEPFQRLALRVTAGGRTHLVEWLGSGRQYLVAGGHPSGQPYRWSESEERHLSGALWEYAPGDLAEVTREKALSFLEALRARLETAGVDAEVEGDGRTAADKAPPQEELQAPSLEALRDVVRLIPNDPQSSPDRTHYLTMGYAIRAAGGDLDLWQEWCAKREDDDGRVDGNPETQADDWQKLAGPYRVGWSWLQEQAAYYSGYVPAVDEFQADRPEEGPCAPVTTYLDRPELLRPPERVSELLAWRGRLSLLWASEKAGKSTTASFDLVKAAREGQRVLWLSFEEPLSGRVTRFNLAARGDREVLSRVFMPKTKPGSWAEVEQMVAMYQPDLVLFDSLNSAGTTLFGKNPDSHQSGEWTDLIQKFRALALGPNEEEIRGVVLIHHSVRGGNRYSGSHGIGAGVDMLIRLKNTGGRSRRLEYTGRWEEAPVSVRYAHGELTHTREAFEADREEDFQEEQKALEAIHSGEASSLRALQRVVGGRFENAQEIVDRLVEAGAVRKHEDGRRDTLEALIDPEEYLPAYPVTDEGASDE